MIPQKFLNYISDMNVWYADGRREPHKPLLLLLALARIQAGKPRLMPFDEIEEKLQQIIEDFGPNRPPHPEYPFWRLRSEEIWEIPQSHIVPTTKSGRASRKCLRDHKIEGGFSTEAFALLTANPELLEQAAMILLNDNYPSSIHQDVLDGVGLEIDVRNTVCPAAYF